MTIEEKEKRIPITLITGFLGSGKTTLLNRLLQDPLFTNSAVIINEFGEVSIDHLLVVKTTEGIIELANGCLCCDLRSDLINTLIDFIDRIQTGRLKKLDRIIIETTGLADPAPILQALLSHPDLAQAFTIDAVLATCNTLNTISILEQYPEAQKQFVFADTILLTKTDLLDSKIPLETLIKTLKAINPTAQIINAHSHQFCLKTLINKTLWDAKEENTHLKKWFTFSQNHHSHHKKIRTFSLDCEEPIHYSALESFLDHIKSLYSQKLLRIKAIIALHDDPHRPIILHGIQAFFHPPIRLPKWPKGITQTRFIIITDNLEKETIQEIFDIFLNKPAIDTADKIALLDNPLVIPGMTFKT
ncbi:CobW family GTP-binding protein [Bartonella sp. F02]|uniref:CobW family GTP-binding protein n=1 Tax=Bartonella sp. F02 TaxID=2967262 RepID=UPI0022A9E8D2|nr:GTP-binding protein [Bartonella sp. F02]MCZ2327895.1 GTP-binding protein [Bartonella sp. F02]